MAHDLVIERHQTGGRTGRPPLVIAINGSVPGDATTHALWIETIDRRAGQAFDALLSNCFIVTPGAEANLWSEQR